MGEGGGRPGHPQALAPGSDPSQPPKSAQPANPHDTWAREAPIAADLASQPRRNVPSQKPVQTATSEDTRFRRAETSTAAAISSPKSPSNGAYRDAPISAEDAVETEEACRLEILSKGV